MRALPGAPLGLSHETKPDEQPPRLRASHAPTAHCSANVDVPSLTPAVKKLYFERFLFRLPSPPRRQRSLSFCDVPNETLVYLSRAPAQITHEDEELTLKYIEFSGKGKVSE